jgi:hypothetical protein
MRLVHLTWLLFACSSKPARDKHEFYGITFTVPAGATLANTGNSLPGPEPEVKPGDPPPPPPYIHPGQSVNGVGVEVWKDPNPTTIAGMKVALAAQKQFVKVDEEVTRPDGYDFTYSWRADDGRVSQVITRYYQFGDEQYSCKYYSSFSKLDEAERVCRSIRKK